MFVLPCCEYHVLGLQRVELQAANFASLLGNHNVSVYEILELFLRVRRVCDTCIVRENCYLSSADFRRIVGHHQETEGTEDRALR